MSWQYLEKDTTENVKRIDHGLTASLIISGISVVVSLLYIPSRTSIVFACVFIIFAIVLSILGNKAKDHYSSLKHSQFDFAFNAIYTFEMFVVSIVVVALNPRLLTDSLIIYASIGIFLIAFILGFWIAIKRYKSRHCLQKEKLPFSKRIKRDRVLTLMCMPLILLLTYDIDPERVAFFAGCGLFVISIYYLYNTPSSVFNLYHELKLSRGESVK